MDETPQTAADEEAEKEKDMETKSLIELDSQAKTEYKPITNATPTNQLTKLPWKPEKT